jgi:large subunit ribosomal protein L15
MPRIERIKHPSTQQSRKRKGRGISSGLGKTSGRGQTGQKSRSGGSIHPRFEGAQVPNIRKAPKYGGFRHHKKTIYYPVNLGDLGDAPTGSEIDLVYLAKAHLLPKKLRGLKVKLLGDGEIKSKLTFKLHAYSHQARAKVEAAGGTCEVL